MPAKDCKNSSENTIKPPPAPLWDRIELCAFADEAGATLAEQIEALSANRISLIELRGIDGRNISDHTPKEAEEIAQTLSSHGITVFSIGSPIGKVKLTDPAEKEKKRFENTLEVARAAGARCIRLFSFYGADALGEDARKAVIERLSDFAETARGAGIHLCHENEKGIYGDSPARCRLLLDALPSLFAVFDPANFIQCGADPQKAWETLADRVAYLHIKDALADGTVVPAGLGVGGLLPILRDFAARGGGVATLEPHLHAFTGLSSLSEEDAERLIGNRRFANSREAFDFAVTSFRALLEKL